MQTPNDDSVHTGVNWHIVTSSKFVKGCKKYSHDGDIKKALQAHLDSFLKVDDPGRLGDRKAGRLAGCLTIRISKSIRLLYVVDYTKHEIRLLDIGDHKAIYGQD